MHSFSCSFWLIAGACDSLREDRGANLFKILGTSAQELSGFDNGRSVHAGVLSALIAEDQKAGLGLRFRVLLVAFVSSFSARAPAFCQCPGDRLVLALDDSRVYLVFKGQFKCD